MPEFGHTAGEWYAKDQGGGGFWSVCARNVPGDEPDEEWVLADLGPERTEETEANARVMAAAADLLEVAPAALSCIQHALDVGAYGDLPDQAFDVFQRLGLAIAKALGEEIPNAS